MAGDWIKIEHSLSDKPEVWQIANDLEIDPDAVVGKLIRMWVWFDNNTHDGNAPSVTQALLDRHVGVTGFIKSVLKVGWLAIENDRLVVINFTRHNGKTAKSRAQARDRQEDFRNKNKDKTLVSQNSNAPSVTNALLEKRREEKRREDKPKRLGVRFKKPTAEQVRDYMAERTGRTPEFEHSKFFDYYEANGWKVGRNPMKDWKAAVRNWLKNIEQRSGKSTARKTPINDQGRLESTQTTIDNMQEFLEQFPDET